MTEVSSRLFVSLVQEMKLWARLALVSLSWAEVVLDRPNSEYQAGQSLIFSQDFNRGLVYVGAFIG